jgi:CheY-like chemotaxis protein
MTEQTRLRKLLVLSGPNLSDNGIVALLKDHFDLQVVGGMDQALEAMRSHPEIDAVLAETANFLPLERGVVTQQASAVLETIADGVSIMGEGGEIIWANRRLREFGPKVLDELPKVCGRAFGELAHCEGGNGRGKRYSIMPGDGTYYEILCSPIRDPAGKLRQVVAVVMDATSQRRQQIKLNAIDRAGRELVRLDHESLISRDAGQRLQLLEERVIRCSRDVLDYEHFTVFLLDQRTNRLECIVWEGLDNFGKKIELFASTEGNGITGYVAATGQSYICPDVHNDPRYIRSLSDAGSTLTVPLRLHDKVIGVLHVESTRANAFSEEDRQFAEIFGNYVAMALHILNLLVYERHNTHTQLSGLISAELSGPLNDIVANLSELVEDYIGHDDLRTRLGQVIDLATAARKASQQIVDASRTGIFGQAPKVTKADPVLNGRKVLVVDDEELMRQTIGDVLGAYGCNVQLACDGLAAIEMIRAGSFDLVLSDIKMPGADGYEVFTAAKTACAQTQVILMTAFGYDPHHSIVRANRQGLSAVLMKPFKVKQLLDECRSALTKSV